MQNLQNLLMSFLLTLGLGGTAAPVSEVPNLEAPETAIHTEIPEVPEIPEAVEVDAAEVIDLGVRQNRGGRGLTNPVNNEPEVHAPEAPELEADGTLDLGIRQNRGAIEVTNQINTEPEVHAPEAPELEADGTLDLGIRQNRGLIDTADEIDSEDPVADVEREQDKNENRVGDRQEVRETEDVEPPHAEGLDD